MYFRNCVIEFRRREFFTQARSRAQDDNYVVLVPHLEATVDILKYFHTTHKFHILDRPKYLVYINI